MRMQTANWLFFVVLRAFIKTVKEVRVLATLQCSNIDAGEIGRWLPSHAAYRIGYYMTPNSRSFQAIKCQCASVGQKCYCTRITFVKAGAEVLNELTCLNSLNEQHDLKENVLKWSCAYACLLFTIPSTIIFSVPRLQGSQKDTLECLTNLRINKHTRGCLCSGACLCLGK